MQHRLRQNRRPPTRKQRRQQPMQRTTQRLRLPRIGHARRNERLHDAEVTGRGLRRGGGGGQVDFERDVAEGRGLGVEQFLRDGGEGEELVVQDGVPEPRGVVFGQGHDALGGAVAEEIGLFDAVDEGVVEDFALRVEFHQLLVRPVAEVYDERPGFGCFSWVVVGEGLAAGCLRGVAAGEEVVEETDGVVPF